MYIQSPGRARGLGLLLLLAVLAAGCGADEPLAPLEVDARALLAELADEDEIRAAEADDITGAVIRHLQAADRTATPPAIKIDYPLEGSIFPPEIVPPTVLWHDTSEADAWFVEVSFSDGGQPIRALVRGGPPSLGPIDPEALAATNEVYRGTPYQQSAHSWEIAPGTWEELKRRSAESRATLNLVGFASTSPGVPLSVGFLGFTTSKDPVGAPLFYRDVPLMPAPNESGNIQPLDKDAIPLIGWRLRDISQPDSKLLLTGMPSCANCHSFSLDGKTLGMDVDGPQGDKGAYAIAPIEKQTVIDDDDVITWNSFADKPEGHKTIGFLSRISPDGRYAITTLNESLYVSNFTNYKFLQVFYPTRGILAWYSKETGEMKALPGADDTGYVQCDPAWYPDGTALVFARAKAFDPYIPGQPVATHANDPNEPTMRYDLYRIPFDEGRGGKPVRIEGASENGMSNTFPKVSPDGKWIVFTKCANGQLMRPDGRLWIVPAAGGEAREMRCNTSLMNSWHAFSPNSRWMAFSSKVNTPYTQMFLTHIDENGNDSPAILVPNCTAANRAVNIPEFLNAPYDALDEIVVPAVKHHRWLAQGMDEVAAGRVDAGIALFEKALEAEPDFSRAHANLGIALADKGQTDAAVKHLERSIEVNPKDASAWNALGWILAQRGDLRQAMERYEYALTLSPINPFVHNNLGLALRQLKKPKQALEHFRRATTLYPDYDLAWKNLGFELLAAGRRMDALDAYRKAVALDASDAVAQRSVGSILLGLGKVADALPHLERAVEHDPQDVASRLGLAWQLSTHPDEAVRNGKRALELATEACELTSWEKPGPLDVLAASYAEAGRYDEAVETVKRAARQAAEGRGAVASGLAERQALYEAKKPFRQDAGTE